MTDEYRFRLIEFNDEELRRTSDLLRLVFPRATHLTPEYLRWQYADNPDGGAVGCNAYAGDELVGTMTAVPMTGRLEGEERRGMFMLNGAVRADHRRRRLQSRISAAIFEESAARGYAFCFGSGNKYSTKPLLTRFRMVKPLEARIGFGLPRRRETGTAPSFERAWSEASMRWRTADPERAFRIGTAGDRSLVTAATGAPGLSAVLYDGRQQWPHDGTGSGTGSGAPRGMRLWIGLDPEISWGRSAYVPIPQRLRTSPLILVFKDLTGGSYVPDPERVVFRLADFDIY